MKFMQASEKDSEFKDEKEMEDGKDSRVYELDYLLVPSIAADDITVHYGNIKELVSSFGGEFISDEMPKMINLAYTIGKVTSNIRNKFNTAYFGWIKFEMDPAQVPELKKKLDLDPSFIRFLILKTVKENTIATKRFVRGESYKKPAPKKTKDDADVVVPINKEEIDKEIDALVAA